MFPISFLSCGSGTNSLKNKPIITITDIMPKQRIQEIELFVKESEPEWYTEEYQQYSSEAPSYGCALAASDQMCSIGIQGVPVLIELLTEPDSAFSGSFPRDYLLGGMYVILRIDSQEALGCEDSYDPIHCISDYYSLSKSESQKIMAEENLVKNKIAKLCKFGIYALPYVIDEIEKGNTEYVSFFTKIGLHLTHKEYAHLAIQEYHYLNELYYDKDYLSGSEDFDYNEWLNENEEDLNNLFKFLDAYCAEYEAEQNSK